MTWRLQPIPVPGASGSGLAGVACPTISGCVAVGTETLASGKLQPFVERWSGRAWRLQSVPEPTGAEYTALDSVACSGAAACTAVGFFGTTSAYQTLPLVERWNGREWQVQSTPDTDNSELTEVSCPGLDLCIAVGDHTRGSYYHILAERWDGTSWRRQRIPDPSDGVYYPYFTGMSCSSGSACTAFGLFTDNVDDDEVMIERWDGTVWRLLSIAGNLEVQGWGVSCPTTSPCIAVGGRQWATWPADVLRVRNTAPAPQPIAGALNQIDCARPWECLAADTTFGGGLVQRWDGRRWRRLPPPPSPHADYPTLGAVSCADVSACTVINQGFVNGGGSRLVADRWNGSSWTLQHISLPAGVESARLNDLACPTPRYCVSVGDAYTAGAGNAPLIERWNGSGWRVEQAAAIPGAVDSSLAAVSCTSDAACTTIGSATTATGSKLVAERWDGARWSLQSLPGPQGLTDIGSADVSCPAVWACVAVGTVSTSDGTQLLLERWQNGRGWRLQSPPKTPPLQISNFGRTDVGLSCASPSACTAVTTIKTSAYPAHSGAAALRWNGSQWQPQPTAHLVGADFAGFSDVACPTVEICMAVGSRASYYGTAVSLAELWRRPLSQGAVPVAAQVKP